MEPVILDKLKKDIIEVIADTIKALESNDNVAVGELSNHIIHCASIFQDEYSVTTAVIIFALSKIIQRENYIDPWIIHCLKRAAKHIQKNDFKHYSKDMNKLLKNISRTDERLDLYIQHVINEAQIKKASKIYAHGISLGQTAEVLGISQWELMRYIGLTKISEDAVEKVSVKSRLSYTKEIFGV